MIGSAMVTMATELFCLNKLLEKFALLPCCILSVVLLVIVYNGIRPIWVI
jgi:hypothetical protein